MHTSIVFLSLKVELYICTALRNSDRVDVVYLTRKPIQKIYNICSINGIRLNDKIEDQGIHKERDLSN